MLHLLKVLPQYIVPQHGLTSIVYRLTRIRQRAIKNFLIQRFTKLFSLDLNDYVRQKPEEFDSFNDFFTRELKPDARPRDNSVDIISPVDGFVSEFGIMQENRLIQAKGKDYSLHDLLANEKELISKYENGFFSTLYLSPRNYHRIHMPDDGILRNVIHVPGKLFGVGKSTTNTVNNLFARNERVILDFDTEYGSMSLVMIGAIFVGSMETIWQGQITPSKQRQIQKWQSDLNSENAQQKIGNEIARFNMGSTVILLFSKDSINWIDDLKTGMPIKMGQGLAKYKN